MHKGKFTDEELAYLRSLEAVERAEPLRITYSKEFKAEFMRRLGAGERPKAIFESAGLGAELIGYKRIERCCAHWREAAAKDALCLTSDKIPSRDDIRARERRRASERVAAVRASKDRKIAELEDRLARQKRRAKTREERLIASQAAEIARLKSQVRALKANGTLARSSRRAPGTTRKSERFELISRLKADDPAFNVSAACEALEVSTSGYYDWAAAAGGRAARIERDLADEAAVVDAWRSHGFRKGSRQVVDVLLRERGVAMNRKKVVRLMRAAGVSGFTKRKRPYPRVGGDGEPRVADNVVARAFMTGRPLAVLSTDITYLPCSAGFVYMSAIIDCETRRLLAHKCSTSMEESFVLETHDQLRAYDLADGVVEQSDQGVHYTARAYREKLKELGIRQSMSRRGNCLDNCPIESFWGRMKEQLGPTARMTPAEVMDMVDGYVLYYNNLRGQARLGWLTPVEYERKLLAA